MPPEVIEQAKRATVMVGTFASTDQNADTPVGSGSGYFINGSGLLITNNHVIDPAHGMSLKDRQNLQYNLNALTYKIITDSGTPQERIRDCELLHQSLTADQALLQAYDEKREKLKTPNFLRFLPPERLSKGMRVCALGFPGGNSQRMARGANAQVTSTFGEVTQVPRTPSGRVRRVVTNVAARPGNSGGPMVDADGHVVGTVTLMGQSEAEANTSYLVPCTLAHALIRDAAERGRIPKGSDLPRFEGVKQDAQHSGVTLAELVAGGDAELVAQTKLLMNGNAKEARTTLGPWLDKSRFDKASDQTKTQVRLLDGVLSLYEGNVKEAQEKLRKCIASKDKDISAYARACVEVLKRYGEQYEGKPIKDPNVFREAGLGLGREMIRNAEDLLRDRPNLKGKVGEYNQYMNKINTREKEMQAAAVLAGPQADDVLIDLWKFAMELCEREYQRLRDEFDKIRAGRNEVPVNESRKLEDIRKKAEQLAESWHKYYLDLSQYGFYYSGSSTLDKFAP